MKRPEMTRNFCQYLVLFALGCLVFIFTTEVVDVSVAQQRTGWIVRQNNDWTKRKKNQSGSRATKVQSNLLQLENISQSSTVFRNLQSSVNVSSPTSAAMIDDHLKAEQQRRIQHIRDACADKSLFTDQKYRGSNSLLYYYSSDYNFSYCKVPKAGCSFWTQVFTILRTKTSKSGKILGMARQAIHRKLKKQNQIQFLSKQRLESQSILVSRDPYSRLFSAFVDKMFLPLFYPHAVEVVKRQRNVTRGNITCANDITFQEFLNDIVQRTHLGKTLNRHWAPIISLCKPCDVNILALVKQESFSTDVEYALKEIGIPNNKYDVIDDALHEHRIDATIPGIVQTVLKFSYMSRNCMSKIEVAKRIWKSFQIQGYLKDTIPFPDEVIDTEQKARKAKILSNIILKTIKKNPLTSEDSKRQRRVALETAFKSVDKQTVVDIQNIYKQDFILFEYSFDPPLLKGEND